MSMTLFGRTVRTSHLIVATVIGGLCVAWVGESLAHRQARRRYQDAVLARRQLELEAGELRAKREELSGALANVQQRVTELDQVVAAKDAELRQILERLAVEQRAIQDLQAKMVAMQYQIDRVQGELAVAIEQRAGSSASATDAVRLDKVVVTQPGSGAPGFYFAGDWTRTGLPATIESAVASGEAVAEKILTSPGGVYA